MKPFIGAALSALILLGTADIAGARDARIRYVTFDNNDVTTVNAALGVSTMIELSPTEVIETISAGTEGLVDRSEARLALPLRQAPGAGRVDQRQHRHEQARLFAVAQGDEQQSRPGIVSGAVQIPR